MLMLDDIIQYPASHWNTVLTTANEKRVKAAAMRARPYSFSDSASRKIGRFATECIDVVTENLEFAIPPFDCTYIEFNIDECIRATGRALSDEVDDTADWKLGFIIDNGMIWGVSKNRVSRDCAVSPWGYLDTSFFDPEALRPGGKLMPNWKEVDADQKHRAAILLGTSTRDVGAADMSKYIDRFALTYFGHSDVPESALKNMLAGCLGEIRFLAAALLFLQSKRGVTIGGVPFERRMARGKSRVFMAHSTVTIDLEGPVEMRRAFSVTDRAKHRAHEVPSHFAHRYGDSNCEHNWIARDDEPTHWDCPLCGRFRYLRKQHMRGDASLGFVTRDYNVTAEGRK